MITLPEHVLRHSVGVAEFMAHYAETHKKLQADPHQFYLIGLLHDIGKLYPNDPPLPKYKGHAKKGGELLRDMGFTKYKDILHHGHPEDGYFSVVWMILNLADMSVNHEGKVIPITERLKSISKRYGVDSDEYKHTEEMIAILKEYKLLGENLEVL